MTEAPDGRLERLLHAKPLVPLWPAIYLAWADGELAGDELTSLVGGAGWVNAPDDRATLEAWVDPDHPPTPDQLLGLRRAIREGATSVSDPGSLGPVQLGLALAPDLDLDESARGELLQMEEQLGFVGTELTRELLTGLEETPGTDAPPPLPLAAFDLEVMQSFLDGAYAQQRRRTRDLLGRPEFRHAYDLDLAARREQVFDWLRILTEEGCGALAFPGVTSERDAGHFFATFETLAAFDASLMTKFGVQFGLFGGAIYHLGTDEQRARWLPAVATLELPGGFAMSELGHGSNVREVETTALWCGDDDEFEIHTPTETARKEWIGNAALHGRMAAVFAQLEVEGEGHGVHALLVPLRDERGRTLPGVRIEDCGPKMGLDGVDNGRIWFDRVRVPRENLLARFGSVSPEGSYSSSIPSPGRRFFTMLGTLVGGRVAVAAGAVSIARVALVHAVRYGARRRQFGPSGEPEVPILDYRMHQLRLLPLVARAYAWGFATQALVDRMAGDFGRAEGDTEALAAGVKALATWSTTDTVQTCREACGGQGYLAVNRFADLKADSDIFATYEGDNVVLLQLVAKALLADFRAQLGDSKIFGVVRFLAAQTATAVTELNPLVVRQRSQEHLRDPEFQTAAFRYRESRLVSSLARRLKHRIDEGMDLFDALNDCQDHAIEAARAFTLRWTLETFNDALARCGRDDLRTRLVRLRDLFALSDIHDDSGWFQQAGYLEGSKARAVRDQVGALCAELRPDAVALVDAFSIPDACLGPIGRGELAG